MSKKVRLLIKGLSYSQTQSGAYALVLGEENGNRKLPVIIGGFEAQSIAIALEKDVEPPRPLTHDLFVNFANKFAIELKEIVIHKLEEGVFFSIMVMDQGGHEVVIDARTSDAVALAIRFGCHIYTYASILEKAGVVLDDKSETPPVDQTETTAPTMTSRPSSDERLKKLREQLDEAVKNEDYERAAKVRDEIDKLTS
jgi:bifunctional DNase/RNase